MCSLPGAWDFSSEREAVLSGGIGAGHCRQRAWHMQRPGGEASPVRVVDRGRNDSSGIKVAEGRLRK